jgi:acetolactate synthase-1/2/3 large subunit
LGFDDRHETRDVTSSLDPSEYLAVAVNWAVVPGATCGGPVITSSRSAGGDGREGESHAHHVLIRAATRKILDEVRMTPPSPQAVRGGLLHAPEASRGGSLLEYEYYCASMSAVADLVVRRLRDAGVRTLFGVPGGGSSLDLIEAAGNAGLPFVLTATETAAAIAALAQAEITGHPGACLTALGPGASSVVNGVACAWLDRVPVIVFTDSFSASAQGRFEHQRLPLKAIFDPLTKCSCRLDSQSVETAVDHALRLSISGRPGPVHIEWPADLMSSVPSSSQPSTAADDFDSDEDVSQRAGPITRDDGSKLAELLAGARKPLLIAGISSRTPRDAEAIRAFSERRAIPAMVTYKAKGVVPDGHPFFAGVFTNAAIEQSLLRESDLIIGAGLDPVELIPRPWTLPAPVVYCGAWPVPADHVPFAVQMLCDVATGLAEMDGMLVRSEWTREQVSQHVVDQRRQIALAAPGLTAQRVIQVTASRLAASARVTVDAGAHMFPATMLWPVREPNGMLISNGLSTMGFALPAAIGASLVDRDRAVVALTGDAGLLMCVGELVTAAREGLRIIVVVFDDSSLSLIEIKQQARQLNAAGVGLAPIDWPALARSVGVDAFAAGDEAELDRAIERALGCKGPTLVDARIDRSNYGDTVRAIRGQL